MSPSELPTPILALHGAARMRAGPHGDAMLGGQVRGNLRAVVAMNAEAHPAH